MTDFFKVERSYYRKLLMYFTFIIFILISGLSSIQYLFFSNLVKDTIKNLNVQVLSQTSYSLTYINNIARNLCQSIYLNNGTDAFIYSNEIDILLINNMIRNIDAAVIPNPNIHSVYIYNRKQDLYLSTLDGGLYDGDDFYDFEVNDLIDSVVENKFQANYPIPRKAIISSSVSDNEEAERLNVFTYIIVEKSSNNPEEVMGAVVLNVRADFLSKTISTMDNRSRFQENEILVINQDGIVVNHISENYFLNDFSDKAYIREILNSGQDMSNFITKIENEKKVVSFVNSEEFNWIFLSISSYESFNATLKQVSLFIVIICILILILGILFSLVLSRNLYSPIKDLISNIKENAQIQDYPGQKYDEVTFISETLKSARHKTEELENRYQSGFLLMKNEYLKNILTNRFIGYMTEKIRNDSSLQIEIDLQSEICLFIIKIDGYKYFIEDFNEKQRGLLRLTLSDIAKEVTSQYYKNEVVGFRSNHYVVLFNTDKSNTENENFNKTITTIIRKIQEITEDQLKISLSAAMGYPIQGMNKLSKLYSDTLDLSMYRILQGSQCLLFPEFLNQVNHDHFRFPASKEKMLLDSMKLGNMNKARIVYNEIITTVSSYLYADIIASIEYIVYKIYNTLSTISDKDFTSVMGKLMDLISNTENYETIEDINRIFHDSIEEIIAIIRDFSIKTKHVAVERTIALIEVQYHDKNLCLKSIADSLKLSPVYLRRLFKESTEKSVAEYIMDVRMEKLKTLLESSNMDINDMLDEIGLEKSNYFYTLFKKYFGMPLSAYKLKRDE